MRFRLNLSNLQVDPRQRAVLDEFVRDAISEAARIWVRAAQERIPSWSGASRATLQALADAVDEHVAIDVAKTAPDRIGLGRLYSRGGIESSGFADYNFFYETQLRYLIANETQSVAPQTLGLRGELKAPTPYEFREAGNAAAQAYLDSVQVPLLPLQATTIR